MQFWYKVLEYATRWDERVAADSARHPEANRGGVTPKRALNMIDVQNEYVDGGAGQGRFFADIVSTDEWLSRLDG